MEKIRGQRYRYMVVCKSFSGKALKNHVNMIKRQVVAIQQPLILFAVGFRLFTTFRNVIFVPKI